MDLSEAIEKANLDLFECPKYNNCLISIQSCISRQDRAINGKKIEKDNYSKCINCKTGEQNQLKISKEPDKNSEPKREEPNPTGFPKPIEKRTCTECENSYALNSINFRKVADKYKNDTNKGFSSKCKKCISLSIEEGHAKGKKKLKEPKEPKEIKEEMISTPTPMPKVKPPKFDKEIVTVDLSKVPGLYKQIEDISKEEIRSIENTIIFAVRKYVNGKRSQISITQQKIDSTYKNNLGGL